MKYEDMEREAKLSIREAEAYAAEHGVTDPLEKLNMFLDRFQMKLWRIVREECSKSEK